ncbi:MAG: MOSC domain-containing protein [Candidatus Sumerlaeaceae bacterium]
MSERILLSIQVGEPQSVPAIDGKPFRTSLFKTPVCEAIWLAAANLEGNRQADLRYHGGHDKAVCCFASEHYAALAEFVGAELPHGAFGENFTLRGMLEGEVCLGDRYRVGDAVVEVSQPRQPCSNLSRRWGKKTLPKTMVGHGFTGFYTRVIEEGMVQPGEPLLLLERPLEQWTIERLNRIMFVDKENLEALGELVKLSQLAVDWRKVFEERLKAGTQSV